MAKIQLNGKKISIKPKVTIYDLLKRFKLDKKLIVPTLSSEKKQLAPRPKYGCLDATKLENLIGMEFCDLDSGLCFIC